MSADTTPTNWICETHGHLWGRPNGHWACRRCHRYWEDLMLPEHQDWDEDDRAHFHA